MVDLSIVFIQFINQLTSLGGHHLVCYPIWASLNPALYPKKMVMQWWWNSRLQPQTKKNLRDMSNKNQETAAEYRECTILMTSINSITLWTLATCSSSFSAGRLFQKPVLSSLVRIAMSEANKEEIEKCKQILGFVLWYFDGFLIMKPMGVMIMKASCCLDLFCFFSVDIVCTCLHICLISCLHSLSYII